MHKNLQHLHGGLRGFAAAAAIASLTAFGCSTNRTPGDGQPAMTAPATPSATPGTSSGTSNPPMASAYSQGVSVDRANDSAAVMAAHQRERFLGTINPSGPQPNPPQPAQATGQFIPPSAYANPQATVNASISSAPTPVITGGDAGGAVFLGGVTTGAATGTTAAATVGATTGTATTAPALATSGVTPTPTTAAIATTPTLTNTTATPTTAAIAATPGQFAAGPTGTSAATGATTTILTPTLTSSVTPSPTRATTMLGALRVTQAGTTTTAASTSSATTSSTATRTLGTARVVVPIRVITNANGTVTVTNVTTTSPTVISNHQ
jgi:hypothetical protein